MFCSKCGNKLNEGDVFCSKCGNSITKKADEAGAFSVIQNADRKATEGAKKRGKTICIVIGLLAVIVVGIVLRPFILNLIIGSDSSENDKKSDTDKKITNTASSTTKQKTLTALNPDNIKATYSEKDGSLTISWEAVADASKYELSNGNSMRVHEDLFKDPVAVVVEGTSYTVKDVKSGQTYFLLIKAVQGSGSNAIYSEGVTKEFRIP